MLARCVISGIEMCDYCNEMCDFCSEMCDFWFLKCVILDYELDV